MFLPYIIISHSNEYPATCPLFLIMKSGVPESEGKIACSSTIGGDEEKYFSNYYEQAMKSGQWIINSTLGNSRRIEKNTQLLGVYREVRKKVGTSGTWKKGKTLLR